MNVLSLFDGISCGMVALERAGIPVERYTAYEIDKYAIQISEKNYPEIEHCGNVFDADFSKYEGYDLLIGGSPCTYWSIAKKDRETTTKGDGFKLFLQYVRALEQSKCKYFLFENVYSMDNKISSEITKRLGVEPITINSALVSAQSRKRLYWTNIPGVTQPQDKGILLKNILVSGITDRDKSRTVCGSCGRITTREYFKTHQGTMAFEPVILNDLNGKSQTIKSQYGKTALANAMHKGSFGATMVVEPVCVQEQLIGRKAQQDSTYKRQYEPRKDGKSGTLTTGNRQVSVLCPARIGEIGKYQQDKVYSVVGKSVTLKSNGGSGGANTGLYKIDLPDGDYIIRKLSPVECERLQTLPDNYTEGISNTQRYKCIGNGWTVDVISHILKNLKEV